MLIVQQVSTAHHACVPIATICAEHYLRMPQSIRSSFRGAISRSCRYALIGQKTIPAAQCEGSLSVSWAYHPLLCSALEANTRLGWVELSWSLSWLSIGWFGSTVV